MEEGEEGGSKSLPWEGKGHSCPMAQEAQASLTVQEAGLQFPKLLRGQSDRGSDGDYFLLMTYSARCSMYLPTLIRPHKHIQTKKQRNKYITEAQKR